MAKGTARRAARRKATTTPQMGSWVGKISMATTVKMKEISPTMRYHHIGTSG
jgi:hypothetical protein